MFLKLTVAGGHPISVFWKVQEIQISTQLPWRCFGMIFVDSLNIQQIRVSTKSNLLTIWLRPNWLSFCKFFFSSEATFNAYDTLYTKLLQGFFFPYHYSDFNERHDSDRNNIISLVVFCKLVFKNLFSKYRRFVFSFAVNTIRSERRWYKTRWRKRVGCSDCPLGRLYFARDMKKE